MTAHLSKLHATGNDFLVWSWLAPDGAPHSVKGFQAVELCDRHRGIGADGLIVVERGGGGADCRMLLFNADGGIAEMSGNGMRCLGWGSRCEPGSATESSSSSTPTAAAAPSTTSATPAARSSTPPSTWARSPSIPP